MKPSSLAKNVNYLLVNSLPLSFRINLLPLKVEEMPVRYALMTSLVLFDVIGIMNI